MQNVLQTSCYNIGKRGQGKYLVQTRSQTKTSSIILPVVHSIDKGIDPNIRLEKQVKKPVITFQTCLLPETKGISQVNPRLGQGRRSIKRKML